MRSRSLWSVAVAMAAMMIPVLPAVAHAQSQDCPAMSPGYLPLKYSGGPTVSAITPCDLMTRLYKYADDSMMGRDVGTEYHHKAVAYIESEVKRLGLKPAGTDGGYYQDFPIWQMALDPASSISANGRSFRFGTDFFTIPGRPDPRFTDLQVVFGGRITDTLTSLDSAAVSGKVLLVLPAAQVAPADRAAISNSAAYKSMVKALAGAAAVIQIQGDSIPSAIRNFLLQPQKSMSSGATGGQALILVTNGTADAIIGMPRDSARRGQGVSSLSADVRSTVSVAPAGRNVVAILEGSDPKLRGEYVAIGGHSDHIGFTPMTVPREHDSLRIWNQVGRPAGAEGGRTTPITPEEWTGINTDIAALRKVYPPRLDSIANGADDDGSGSVSVLEMAEAFAHAPQKPKRSILFVWHAGEEKGMWGSGYFMDHPTVPRDSIVAQLNIDMVGRGEATDVTGRSKDNEVLHGGPGYLQLVGSHRLSTELGDLVESVNKERHHDLSFDYSEDADGHPQNIYCRSDHWSYAKWGVPVVFFTTGGHADYHQVTDEPQYIQYRHMAKVDSLIFDVAAAVANLDHRVVVDHPKPDPAPATSCKQ